MRGIHDGPGSIEGYYFQTALMQPKLSYDAYMTELDRVTAEQVAQAANSLRYHSSWFLKGVEA